MVDFRKNKRVETPNSSIKVDAGLPVGKYFFQLTTIDVNGKQSNPARINVTILRTSIENDSLRSGPVRPARVRSRITDTPEILIDTSDNKPGEKKAVRKKSTKSKTTRKVSARKSKRSKKSDTDSI